MQDELAYHLEGDMEVILNEAIDSELGLFNKPLIAITSWQHWEEPAPGESGNSPITVSRQGRQVESVWAATDITNLTTVVSGTTLEDHPFVVRIGKYYFYLEDEVVDISDDIIEDINKHIAAGGSVPEMDYDI